MNQHVFFTFNQLINYNAYVGGWQRVCHRSFNQFIIGWRLRFSILNIDYLFLSLKYSLNIFRDILLNNANILLVCRKLRLPFDYKKQVFRFQNLYIYNRRWNAGLLTNYQHHKQFQNTIFGFPSFVLALNNRNEVVVKECAKANIWCSSLCDVNTNLYTYTGLPLVSNSILKTTIYFFVKLFLQHTLMFFYFKKLKFLKRYKYYLNIWKSAKVRKKLLRNH